MTRTNSPQKAAYSYTCRPRGVFPDVHAAGENEFKLILPPSGKTLRGFERLNRPAVYRRGGSYLTTTFSSPSVSFASCNSARWSNSCVPNTLRVSAITSFTGVPPGNI